MHQQVRIQVCKVDYSGLNGSFLMRYGEESGALPGLLNPKKLQQFKHSFSEYTYLNWCVFNSALLAGALKLV